MKAMLDTNLQILLQAKQRVFCPKLGESVYPLCDSAHRLLPDPILGCSQKLPDLSVQEGPMLLIFGFVLFLLVSALILFLPALWARQVHHAYAAPRAVICPETHRQVGVTIDANRAAVTGFRAVPDFRLADCTRWPARAKCAQECLPQALRNEPYTQGEVRRSRTVREIYHLPVLLAAFVAWCFGIVWHSHYLFRACWMAALGLTPAQVKQLVSWYSPHLLSIGGCLLFAYGVAWLQTWLPRSGFWHGILSATLLWTALMVTTSPSIRALPRDLLVIEGGYTLIATILVGAIIGGLSGKLILPEHSTNPLEA